MTAKMKVRMTRGPGMLIRSKRFRHFYGIGIVALCCLYVAMVGYSQLTGPAISDEADSSSRSLLSGGGEIIPGFSGDCAKISAWENDSGAVLHVIICVYLFLGIAVICDEQFTSSLESISHPRMGLGLSPDVAGATFMAAGSSAPELASSFMGTFISKSDVGLGTIIGSAVFNILIIIGATAVVVGEDMQLDWKPLTRDCTFYLGSVALLIIFVAPDNLIETYDAAILLVYYVLYIVFMYFNTGVMRWVAIKCGEKEEKPHRSRRPSFSSGVWAQHTKDSHHAQHEDDTPLPTAGKEEEAPTGPAAGYAVPSEQTAGTGSGRGRASIVVQDVDECVLFQDDDQVSSSPGFAQGSGSGVAPEPAAETEMTTPPTMGDTVQVSNPLDEAKDVEAGVTAGAEEKKEEEEKEGKDDEEEEESLPEKICNICGYPYVIAFMLTMPDCKYEEESNEEADEEIAELMKEKKGASADRIKEIESEVEAIEKRKDLRDKIEECEEEATSEKDKEAAVLRKELFALYEPLTCSQRYFLVTFFVSLLWITILSYFMVTLMEKIGCVWGISSFIMGLTLLAAGTSVPDALGSIAVAKEGEGDMAVSNAIGSNVFDICMGLGLPWVIATAIDGKGRTIKASVENIGASVGILVGIVVALYASLLAQKDKETGKRFVLTRTVGYILFATYFAFLIFEFVWVGAGLPE